MLHGLTNSRSSVSISGATASTATTDPVSAPTSHPPPVTRSLAMTDGKIERYKRRDQLDVEEELRYRREHRLPETSEYVEARHEALVNAGLEDEDSPAPDDAEMTVDDHLKRIQSRGRP